MKNEDLKNNGHKPTAEEVTQWIQIKVWVVSEPSSLFIKTMWLILESGNTKRAIIFFH